MEEEILKIINNKFYDYSHGIGKMNKGQFKLQTARDVTSHVMEFIEWITRNTMREMHGKFCIAPLNLSAENVYYTLDEIYDYWSHNVKNGK